MCPQFLTSKNTFPKSFILHNLKLLVLRTGFTRYDLVGMAALLKLCPNLETLILEHPFKMEKDVSSFTYRIIAMLDVIYHPILRFVLHI